MCEMKKGSIVKLNPIIFPYDKRKEYHFQTVNLNYPAIILVGDMKVLDFFTDSYHGEMLTVKILNDDRVESRTLFYVVKADCITIKE